MYDIYMYKYIYTYNLLYIQRCSMWYLFKKFFDCNTNALICSDSCVGITLKIEKQELFHLVKFQIGYESCAHTIFTLQINQLSLSWYLYSLTQLYRNQTFNDIQTWKFPYILIEYQIFTMWTTYLNIHVHGSTY